MEALSTTGRPIEERVAAIISDQLGVEISTLTPDAHLLDDLGADSLDVVELVMALEESFGIVVPDDDVEQLQTLLDVQKYLELRTAAS